MFKSHCNDDFSSLHIALPPLINVPYLVEHFLAHSILIVSPTCSNYSFSTTLCLLLKHFPLFAFVHLLALQQLIPLCV